MFEKETAIGESRWRGVYWARWGDALSEAGFAPNEWQRPHSEDLLLEKLALACRHFGKFPTFSELRLYGKQIDATFPSTLSHGHRFDRGEMLDRLRQWVSSKKDFADVAPLLPAETKMHPAKAAQEGFVYLIRSGAHYKLGRSDELERRVKEITIALPEAASLVHAIRTDDPSGIEAYWHRRFADRRANGEWFKLSAADIAAFKRRKYQ